MTNYYDDRHHESIFDEMDADRADRNAEINDGPTNEPFRKITDAEWNTMRSDAHYRLTGIRREFK